MSPQNDERYEIESKKPDILGGAQFTPTDCGCRGTKLLIQRECMHPQGRWWESPANQPVECILKWSWPWLIRWVSWPVLCKGQSENSCLPSLAMAQNTNRSVTDCVLQAPKEWSNTGTTRRTKELNKQSQSLRSLSRTWGMQMHTGTFCKSSCIKLHCREGSMLCRIKGWQFEIPSVEPIMREIRTDGSGMQKFSTKRIWSRQAPKTTTSPQHLLAELMVTREGDYPKHLGFITAGCSTSKRRKQIRQMETNAVHPRIFIFEHPNFSLTASGHVNFQVLG